MASTLMSELSPQAQLPWFFETVLLCNPVSPPTHGSSDWLPNCWDYRCVVSCSASHSIFEDNISLLNVLPVENHVGLFLIFQFYSLGIYVYPQALPHGFVYCGFVVCFGIRSVSLYASFLPLSEIILATWDQVFSPLQFHVNLRIDSYISTKIKIKEKNKKAAGF